MTRLVHARPSPRMIVLLGVSALSLAACRKKPAPAPATTTTVNTDSINAARARQDSIARAAAERARADSIARANADRDARLAAARAALTAAVYFDYDAAEIRDDTRAALEAKLPLLTANPAVRLRIAGHTDSRGSDEYNLALGARRAASVKAWLAERGVDASRLEVVSFGEERGTCAEEDEGCWARNRRAEFEITAGGTPLALPNAAR